MKLMIGAASLSTAKFAALHKEAEKYFDEIVLNPYGRKLEENEIYTMWDCADAIIFGNEAYSAEVLAKAPRTLKVLAKNGVGYDNVDLKAARMRGIDVCNTPGTNSDSVADMALALILCVQRNMVLHDELMRECKWKRLGGHELSGKTIGVLGMGSIGKGVIKRAVAFGMKAIAFDLYFDDKFAAEYGVERMSAEDVISNADVLSLHLPTTPETAKIINAESLKTMKPEAIVINTARGELIDEAALCEALENGVIAGAGLDVFEHEPLGDSPLINLPNVVLTPHIAGNTTESGERVGMMALQNIMDIINGRPCKNIVNK